MTVLTPLDADRERVVPLGRVLLATVITLTVAAIIEASVWAQGGHNALGDIAGRYFAWHLHPSWLPFGGGPIEYPVVVGYVSWIATWFGRRASTFVIVNGLVSAGLALTLSVVLRRRSGPRIWRWAAGVPLALYAFHNWDILAMTPAIVGLLAFEAERDVASGALLAVGASAKVFPGLFLPPLAVIRWHAGDRRGAARFVGAFVVTTIALNAPIALKRWETWTFPIRFQGARSTTWGALWFWLLRIPGVRPLIGPDTKSAVDALAVFALVAALVLISVLAVRRRLGAVEVGAAVVGAFLLANKVYSPNYDLWIVPFFALLPIGRRTWVAYCLSDLAIFVLVYGHFHGQWSTAVVSTYLPALVVVRAVTILAVIAVALRLRGSGAAGPGQPDRGGRGTNGLVRST